MQKRFYLTPAAVILFILYFTVFGDRGLLRINHLHRDRDEMQKKLTELKDENEKLRREISALQSDRRYLESIARRDFGLVRKNEIIYQFPQEKGAAPSAAKPADPGGDAKAGQPAPAAPAAKAAANVEPKPAAKAEPKPAAKAEPKPAAKPEEKAKPKTQAKAEPQESKAGANAAGKNLKKQE